jgi:hypothetical protein
MSLVVARWTDSWAAGVTSGILFAFNAHSLTRVPHLQAQHAEFLPLALFALDRVLREPTAGHAVRLAAWFVLQALTSIYLLIFTAFALTAAALARPRDWIGRRFGAVAPHIALAAVLAGLLLLPYLLPYWRLYAEQGLARPLRDIGLYSASWRDYLSTPSRLHYPWWSHRWFTGAALFPGFVGLALSAFALVRGTALRDARARMCLAMGLCGAVLSLGTNLPAYGFLYEVLAPLRAIRAVSRFGFLAIAGVAVLAGFGLRDLSRTLSPRAWPAVAAIVVAAAALEPLSAPLGFRRFDGVSPIYDIVAEEANAVVVEIPMPAGARWFANANYMLNATRHWKPMLNGYSGFAPGSFYDHAERLNAFPASGSIEWLRTTGVTHVFVHVDELSTDQQETLKQAAGLRRIASDGPIQLYAVVEDNRP